MLQYVANNRNETGQTFGSAHAKWSDLQESSEPLVQSDCLPLNIQLRDPSHLKQDVVNKIYTFWLQKQKKKEKPLIFHNNRQSVPHIAKKKKASSYVDLSDDEDEHVDHAATLALKRPKGSSEGTAADRIQ